MLNFSDFSMAPLITFCHIHPYISSIITFLIVAMETTIVGAVLPGVIIMPAIGFLMGSNVLPMGNTFLFAICGAITGDYVSYFLGAYFKNRIHNVWPFTKWPRLLDQGEKYFHAHGGKSIFISRFVMVVRTIIPVIAGMLKLPLARFSVAAVPSAILWVICYLSPGLLLGALSLELPPKAAAKFAFYALIINVMLFALVLLVQHFFKKIWKLIDYCIKKIWIAGQKNQITKGIVKFLSDPKKPDNHQQLTLLIFALVSSGIFGFILQQVMTNGFLTKFDKPICYLATSLRTPFLDHVIVMFTMLGEIRILAVALGIIFVWFLWKRYFYIAYHWFCVVLFSSFAVYVLKCLTNHPRPGMVLYETTSSSFPSGHTVTSLVVFGFLAVIIARESKKQDRTIPYIVSGILIASIALSRLYLGAHWLTDVLGSLFLGSAILLLATVSYRRRHNLHFSAHKIFVTALGVFIATWLVAGYFMFNKQFTDYALNWSEGSQNQVYRLNRFGTPVEPLNVVFNGDINKIKDSLAKDGWQNQTVKIDYFNIIRGFFDAKAIHHMPIFTQLYQNKAASLCMTLATKQDHKVLVLCLWEINSSKFIGTIKYYCYDSSQFLSLDHFKYKFLFTGATKDFSTHLNSFKLKHKNILLKEQLAESTQFSWDGDLLTIT